MLKDFKDFCLSIVVVIIIASVITCIYVSENYKDKTQTKALTILHTWEEGGQYYFADELGCVYHIVCGGKYWSLEPKGEIRYDDMPKVRFDKLEEGQRYHVKYFVRQGDVRMSLGEEEMRK